MIRYNNKSYISAYEYILLLSHINLIFEWAIFNHELFNLNLCEILSVEQNKLSSRISLINFSDESFFKYLRTI